MKKIGICLQTVLAAAVLQLILLLSGCSGYEEGRLGSGQLRISFEDTGNSETRSGENLPDTSEFQLIIEDASGNVIYSGLFGACPESLEVTPGSYTVRAVSEQFSKPKFSSPQYGDEQCVIVPSGGSADVRLLCRQMNAGVQLEIDKSFLTACPDGALLLKSTQGKLMYSYSEKRIAYFLPGSVSLVLSSGGEDETLFTRNLKPQQILVIGVSAAKGSDASQAQGLGSISIDVDTSKVWMREDYVIGGSSDKGTSEENALTVAQAISNAPQEDVWVSGYIVGGDLTSANASFDEPFTSRTNLLLGPKSSTEDRDACIAVQLQAGEVRNALNLVDNPSLLGRKICLKGNLVEAYYGLTGLKGVEEFRL